MNLHGTLPLVTATLALTTPAADATWSIVMTDSETGEVAVGTVTCLTTFDLCAIVPVVVVGKGGAAVQAAGDFNGIRRPVIFEGLMNGTAPADILVELSSIGGHQQRQYGIVDTNGDAITFTGVDTLEWAGGVTGADGTLTYAIQGNILAGPCVVPAIEAAILGTDGDMAGKLMAGMQAAREQGGDGRCSCDPNDATACGCPPASFTKSGHIGCMVVSRHGDANDIACNSGGCADGDYYLRINVANQSPGAPDPVEQLQGLFDDWRQDITGRPDGLLSTVTFDPPTVPADGASETTMTVTLVDWLGDPSTVPLDIFFVTHGEGSAGLATFGTPVDQGNGVWAVPVTAGSKVGTDTIRIDVCDGFHRVQIRPLPELEHVASIPGDFTGDGVVDVEDLVEVITNWGNPYDVTDLVEVITAWS